ncbi:MAG: alanine racemase [Solirubrobacterales bacterium]
MAEIDLGAVTRNCRRLDAAAPGAVLCAVVKADGYGHGVAACAQAAMDGGARWLAVVSAPEARDMRATQPDVPVLVMGPLDHVELRQALAVDADIAVWHPAFLEAVIAVGRELGVRPRIHVKLDTGMGRLGTRDPERAWDLVQAAAAEPAVELVGFWTHFATADIPGDPFFAEQLGRFDELAVRVGERYPDVLRHAANSAATLRDPASHYEMVRCGIAIYGLDPLNDDPGPRDLEPALALRSYVADVKEFGAGTSAGYGRSWRAPQDTCVGVVPIGYGDGVRRGLSNNAEVLIGGRRRPVVGTVSMDSITVDLGPATDVTPGAEAVLIGSQRDERILCEELARRLDTINYEITCGISARVPRRARAGA